MKNLLLISFLFIFSCQKQNLEIDQDKVEGTLKFFGKENLETKILVTTSLGKIEIKLYNETPLHRANFIRLIKSGFYKEKDFYRIVKGVCIQGGGQPEKLSYLLPAEFKPNLIHKKGALAMARYMENNPKKMSSATEFFIVSKGKFYEASDLQKYSENQRKTYLEQGGEILYDNEYTVFGEVIMGLEVVEKISDLEVYDIDKTLKAPKFTIEISK